MSIETRLSDPEYQNWLKCGQALRVVVDGLRQFANDTVQSYHDDLKNLIITLQLGTSTCNKQCKAKISPPTTCVLCTSWKNEMMTNHSTKMVFWTNVDPKLWPLDKWEMAKFYMPRGQKANVPITASDLDSTHMLNLIINCKEFHKHLSTKKLPEKVLQVRNHLMHSPTMTIQEGTLQDDFKVFLQLLQDGKKLHQLPEPQKSVQEIQKLLKMNLTINFQNQGQDQNVSAQQALTVDEVKCLEKDLIRERMNDFEARLEAFENLDTSTEGADQDDNTNYQILSQNIADLQAFVDANLDLKTMFGTELQNIKSKCEDVEQRVAILEYRVDSLENQTSESDSDISPDTEPAGLDPFMLKAIRRTAPVVLCLFAIGIALMQHQSHKRYPLPDKLPAASYKNLLQELTQKNKAEKPSYVCPHEELGFTCTVTVLGKEYKSPNYHRTGADAEQNAAKVAYDILKIRKVAEATKSDDTNYKGNLQEHQAKCGLGIPTYEAKHDGAKFRAKVTVPMPDGEEEVFVTDTAEGSKREAEHKVAKKALEYLSALGDLPKPPAKTPVVKTPAPKVSVEKSQVVMAPTTGAIPKGMKAVPQDDSTSDTNFKGKLQEHQQKYERANPTYETTSEGTKFRAEVTVPMPDGEEEVFVTDTAEGSKREAEHKVAKKALASLSALDDLSKPPAKTPVVQTPAATVPVENPPAGPAPKVKKIASQDDSSSDPSQNYKGDLQILLQKSQSITSGLPKYEDIEVPSQPGTYRSQVTVNTKYILQNDCYYSSKKEAEKDAAKHALKQLEVPDWNTVDNPKGKLQEINSSVKYHTVEVEPKQFQCTLILSSLNKMNKVVVYADKLSKTKKERQKTQQLVAKKMLDWLRNVEVI